MTPRDDGRHTNARIDSAINDAASRLTNAKPSDALRANVMSRIGVEPAARLRAWRFGVAFGALASIALVAFVSWPANSTIINPTVINSQSNPTADVGAPSPVTSVVNAARIERTASFTPGEADLEWSAMAPPALERPDPLQQVTSLEMRPIDNITPLNVAPIVVPALGDGSNR